MYFSQISNMDWSIVCRSENNPSPFPNDVPSGLYISVTLPYKADLNILKADTTTINNKLDEFVKYDGTVLPPKNDGES